VTARPVIDRLLTPGETYALLRVCPRTVTRWANAGLLTPSWTPGGHRRFREDEVLALLEKRRDGKRMSAARGGRVLPPGAGG
jgi:excisionase family DNA binding protein